MTTPDDLAYTVDEAAERARVHPQTIRRAIRLGWIRASKLGQSRHSRVVIPATALADYIQGRSPGLESPAPDAEVEITRRMLSAGRIVLQMLDLTDEAAERLVVRVYREMERARRRG